MNTSDLLTPAPTPTGIPTPDPTPAPTPTPQPPATPPVEWVSLRNSLPDDLKNDPSLGTITSLEGLTKSYIHAQKAIGQDKIPVPSKHATPDDWKGVFHKLGVPEKLDDYKLNLEGVEVDKDIISKVSQIAHEKGILPWQLESVIKGFNDIALEVSSTREASFKTQAEESVNALKKEWGSEFDNQVKRANVAMRHLLPDAKDQQALIDAGLGTNPALLKMLAGASKMMKEDDFISHGEGRLAGVTPAEALQKARAIQSDMSHPYRNPEHPNHKAAKEEVRRLYDISFPE